jgi:molybdopterin-containing oxidoreductase family membrane subunit
MREDHKKAQIAGLLGFVSAISAHSNLGAIFGFLEARPFWHGPYLPIYFILSALVSGSALIILVFAAVNRGKEMSKSVENAMKSVGKLLALFLGILIFFEVWKVITSLYGAPPEKYETVMALLAGPLSINFYVFEIFLGMLLPFIIIVATNGSCVRWLTAASASTMIGIFFMRYDLVIAGQLVPMRRSLDGTIVGNYPGGLAHYTPPVNELFVVIGAIGLCVLLYTFGEMLLNLNEKDAH